ncbi:MAG: nucleoside phosphorylase [Eubacteriales bacterium]|nr:nucleoside phosphorylase [Eubacteriales bacterium]
MLQPHINLDDKINTRYAILPGDPARLDRISTFLTDVEEISFNREYRSLTGYYKGVKILAISTGMGGTSTAIAVEELKNIGVKAMIRIGSCGTMQSNIKVGDIIISSGSVRDEGTSRSYVDLSYPAVPDPFLMMHCIESAEEFNFPHHVGITRSHESFYSKKEISLEPYWQEMGILGDDMETSALFTVGSLLGIKTAAILNNVVPFEGEIKDGIGGYSEGQGLAVVGERNEIEVALEAFYKLSQKQ